MDFATDTKDQINKNYFFFPDILKHEHEQSSSNKV